MAKDTAKKNARRNQSRLAYFLYITVAINAIDVLILFYYAYHSGWFEPLGHRNSAAEDVASLPMFIFPWYDWMRVFFWASQEYFAIKLLSVRGAPEVDQQSGEIQDCIDLGNPEQLGFYSYAQDCLWLCWFVQLTTCLISNLFWIFYLVIPAFAVYKLWGTVLSPLLNHYFGGGGRGGGVGTEDGAENEDPRSRIQRRRQELREKGRKPVKAK